MAVYSIKEVATLFDCASSTLRYYEEIGLLPLVERDAHKQRIYTDVHINRLHAIACFKRTGLPISKMKAFFSYESDLETHIDEIISLVTEHEDEIHETLLKLQQDLAHIHHKVLFYRAIKQALEAHLPLPSYDEVIHEG